MRTRGTIPRPRTTLDRTVGLDRDNPLGGDSWVTSTLGSIPSLIGAYDSHRYATIWGVENGVYGDQVRARREQISNVDSPPSRTSPVRSVSRRGRPHRSLRGIGVCAHGEAVADGTD